MERKKRNAATIAIAMCVAFERSGLVEGKIPDASVQTIRTKTTIQLQLTPNSIPAIRPRRKLLPIGSVFPEPPSTHASVESDCARRKPEIRHDRPGARYTIESVPTYRE